MDCIVWAQRKVVAESTTTLVVDGGLEGDDIQRILSVSLIDENLLAGSSQPECSTESVIQNSQLSSQSEGDDTDDGSKEGDVNKLQTSPQGRKSDTKWYQAQATKHATGKCRNASKGH